MIILNFSHPLTGEQVEQAVKLVDEACDTVIDVAIQFDTDQPFSSQVREVVAGLNIATEAWQGTPFLVVLPSLNYIAGVLLAELHGRMGHFPAILRLKPIPDTLVTRFAVAEIINLESVRQSSRKQR